MPSSERRRVLRGDHHERRRERPRLAVDRDLLLLHRLQQTRLRLRGRTVELVDEHDVREHRPGQELERAALRPPDAGADDVARKQVDRRLHAREAAADALGERAREPRLADARMVLDEQMTARHERGQHDVERRPRRPGPSTRRRRAGAPRTRRRRRSRVRARRRASAAGGAGRRPPAARSRRASSRIAALCRPSRPTHDQPPDVTRPRGPRRGVGA